MKNNKILIGYNYELEAQEQRQSTAKEVARNNLVKYVTNVCKLQPTEDFTMGDIIRDVKGGFLDKWSNSLPEGIEDEKMLVLVCID